MKRDSLLDFLIATGEIDKQDDERKREIEKEMEDLDLTDAEKELVREGKYDPTSFDYEQDEDDDYYSEDDD